MVTISTIQGDTKSITITCTQNSSPYDLTSKSVLFTVKNKNDNDVDDSTALISKEYTSGTTSGTASIVLSHADTNIAPGNYLFNIRITNSSATEVLSSQNGMFEVTQGATNRVS
jgi:hypothetical protein